ncbi:MAG: hypothetical protein WKF40_09870 [Thermoleophilaceae bacterium]
MARLAVAERGGPDTPFQLAGKPPIGREPLNERLWNTPAAISASTGSCESPTLASPAASCSGCWTCPTGCGATPTTTRRTRARRRMTRSPRRWEVSALVPTTTPERVMHGDVT